MSQRRWRLKRNSFWCFDFTWYLLKHFFLVQLWNRALDFGASFSFEKFAEMILVKAVVTWWIHACIGFRLFEICMFIACSFFWLTFSNDVGQWSETLPGHTRILKIAWLQNRSRSKHAAFESVALYLSQMLTAAMVNSSRKTIGLWQSQAWLSSYFSLRHVEVKANVLTTYEQDMQ